MVHGPVVDFHAHRADLHVFALGEAVGDLAANHALDDALLADRLLALVVDGFDGAAVADDRYFVRHIGNLVQLVGNDDHGHSLLLEAEHQVQQCAGIFFVQGGRGFVQDQQLRLLGQGFGDLDQLLLAGADGFDLDLGAFLQAHHFQVFIGFGIGLIPVDGEAVPALVAQVHVFADRHFGHQGQFLVNDDDAQFFGILDVGKLADLSVVDDIALVRSVGVDTAQHVHQGGFARAVLADQRVDLALFHLEVHVIKRFYTGESLCDIFHFQQNLCHGVPPAFLRWK